MNTRPYLFLSAALLVSTNPAISADACFASSKTYQIHRLHGGGDVKDGWTVEGDAFAQCVHRAEAADKALHARYPETVYNLSLAATIGCHSPCN
ncbi:MAG TPA: hypothetical protein VHX92_07280 [Rhizomicrobium sp.]|jgi:hypothetical protein|nr:hypothetical protein [Rhizomicrobium sp.]